MMDLTKIRTIGFVNLTPTQQKWFIDVDGKTVEIYVNKKLNETGLAGEYEIERINDG